MFLDLFFFNQLILIQLFCSILHKNLKIPLNIFFSIFIIFLMNIFISFILWNLNYFIICRFKLFYLQILLNGLTVAVISQCFNLAIEWINIIFYKKFNKFIIFNMSDYIVMIVILLNADHVCYFYIKEYIINNFFFIINSFFIIIIISKMKEKISITSVPSFLKGIPILIISIEFIFLILLKLLKY